MDQPMPLRGHLEELRTRLLISSISVTLTTILAFVFYKRILDILLMPADSITSVEGRLVFTEVTEVFAVMMKVSLVSGIGLAFPIILYQIVTFVSPGLTPRERKYLFAFMPGVLLAFLSGIAFGYFILIPPAVNFLISFGEEIATPMIRLANYVNLVTRLLFWMGVVFETPMVMFILAKLHIISPAVFSKWRRYWVVIAFILGAIITPTFDPINQCLVAAPLIILYEVGLLLAKLAVRGQTHSAPAHPPNNPRM